MTHDVLPKFFKSLSFFFPLFRFIDCTIYAPLSLQNNTAAKIREIKAGYYKDYRQSQNA